MTDKSSFIKDIKPYRYEDYASVSSREKLVVFAMKYLSDHGAPLTFNNICITTFKLFPERFYFSEEFKEYPHIEMLNRTILHLRPIERNYASGSVRTHYKLTPIGEEVAGQVAAELNAPTRKVSLPKKAMDIHKKTAANDYRKIKDSELLKKFRLNNDIDEMEIWEFFEVTPYTQLNKIKTYVKGAFEVAQTEKDADVVALLKTIEKKVF